MQCIKFNGCNVLNLMDFRYVESITNAYIRPDTYLNM